MKSIKRILLLVFICQSFNLFSITPDELMKINFNADYSNRKVNELRLIRSMVYARHGYLFKTSDLRDYYMTNFKWYDSIIWHNAELEWNNQPVPKMVLTQPEKVFIAKIDTMIAQRCKQNLVQNNGYQSPVLDNLYNWFDFKEFNPEYKECLSKYGFAIVKDKHEQLFHLYDQNQYNYIPSFVTTDLYLQLLHTYFSYTLKKLEKDKLIGLVEQLTKALYTESMKYTTSDDKEIKQMAGFNACFFAVAYSILTDKTLSVSPDYAEIYKNEISNLKAETDGYSKLFNSGLPYSLSIPRGYYTRNQELARYFKAMIWLQIAPYCLKDEDLLKQACFNAFILNTAKDVNQKPVKQIYNSVYEPLAFLIGDADNLSISDICDVFTKNNISKVESLGQKSVIDMVFNQLQELEKTQDQIQPKIKITCYPKINFMPQRYLVDNDILQQFVDIKPNAKKAYPRGLEVFASFGIDPAKNILYNFYNEPNNWNKYEEVLAQQTQKFKNFNNWNATVYNKWIESLVKLNKVDITYPYFMQNDGWKIKNLNTSLASWTELKHDVILYGEQPMAAEMGDGGDELPPPVTVEYVEPNIDFWNTCHELLEKTNQFLVKYNLNTDDIKDKSDRVKDILDFFISVTVKELNNQTLTDDEYRRIEYISGEFDYLSLKMLNPYINYSDWYEVIGPDKTIALIADVYTRNIYDCPKNGILHEATGYGNTIYVVVEINKRLYLTRGATFTYYEFPYQQRLTDESWLDLLNENKFNPVEWTKEITVGKMYPSDDNEY
jgi:hypothetical protein